MTSLLADDHDQKPASHPDQEMTMMLDPTVRHVLDGTPFAHLASILPDGAPHTVPVWIGTRGEHIVILTGPQSRKARNLRRDPRVAISLTPPDNPFQPVIVRGRVVEWIDGDAGWDLVDQIAQKYIGQPYGRDVERVIGVIEVDHQTVGVS